MKFFLRVFVCLVLFLPATQVSAEMPPPSYQTLIIESQEGGRHYFNVELAITPKQQQKGLMFRKSMPDDYGMMFFFGQESDQFFWMKNTLIPLDMIFIKKNGVIHHIHENAEPHSLERIGSNGPISAVLEVNGGLTSRLGLKPGDRVYHSFFEAVPD